MEIVELEFSYDEIARWSAAMQIAKFRLLGK